MTKRTYHLGALALALALSLLGVAGSARPLPAADNDAGISRNELGRLDLFLDSHPDIAQALTANPALATNRDFVSDHPAWKAFLEDHPAIREGLMTNTKAFMRAEDRFDATEATKPPRPATKPSLSEQYRSFDNFLDQHPAIAKQLEANPSLVKQKDYVTDHPELLAFLKNQPVLRDSLLDNPRAFMKGIATVDAAEGKATGGASSGGSTGSGSATMPPTKAPASDALTQSELVKVDAFLDANPTIAKQLEANPSLINNKDFLKDNPKLVDFLTDNPSIRTDWTANPSTAMTALSRIDQLEASKAPHGSAQSQIKSEMASFEDFLDQHPVIAKQLEANPAMIRNKDYVQDHPELMAFLKGDASMRDALLDNPQAFIKGAEADAAAEATAGSSKPATMPPTKAPAADNDGLGRGQIIALDKFLDANPGLAKQLEANPSLIQSSSFMSTHSDLQTFLTNHPDLAEDWTANPGMAMTDLRRFDNLEAARSIGSGVEVRTAVVNFDNFLDSHPGITAELMHHPTLASTMSYIDSHPELKSFLQTNPGVAAELRNNPQMFMNLLSKYDNQEATRSEKKEDLKPTIIAKHK